MWVRESPQYMREGETRRYAHVWEGAASVSTPTDEVYANGSSQGVLTGSASVAGNVQTSRILTAPAGSGGLSYVFEFSAVVDGETRKSAVQIEVLRPGQEQ